MCWKGVCIQIAFPFSAGLGLHVWQGEEGPQGRQAQVTAPCHLQERRAWYRCSFQRTGRDGKESDKPAAGKGKWEEYLSSLPSTPASAPIGSP